MRVTKTTAARHARTLPVLAVAATLFLLLTGCAPQLLKCPAMVKAPSLRMPDQHPAPVLFATDRLPESLEKLTFSSALNPSGDHMSYGIKCEDPAHAKVACDVESLGLDRGQFLARIKNAKSDIVLYVHGFNYTFDESLEVTLSIVQRARFPATPVAYSWPSQAKAGGYGIDYDMSEWTIDHLAAFIREVTQAMPADFHLHIVTHSMGNRAVLLALARLDLADLRLGQLILIAPDVDAQIFTELIAHSGPFRRKTLYVSQRDWALRAAGFLHSSAIRAGDARKQYLVLSGVDTVDLSPLKAGVTGHSIYDYSQLMFEDLGAVLKDEAVAKRKLTACTVKTIESLNAATGKSLPCVVFRMHSE